jgi:hypothetical protein
VCLPQSASCGHEVTHANAAVYLMPSTPVGHFGVGENGRTREPRLTVESSILRNRYTSYIPWYNSLEHIVTTFPFSSWVRDDREIKGQ